jgi:hypothetical protein
LRAFKSSASRGSKSRWSWSTAPNLIEAAHFFRAEANISYPLDLDEYAEERILLELSRRGKLRARGVCDYCERPPAAPACKFPRRHADKRIGVLPLQAEETPVEAIARKLAEAADGGEARRREKYHAMQTLLVELANVVTVESGRLQEYKTRAAAVLRGSF